MKTGWWTVVFFGSTYDGPRGPWKSEEAANEAVQEWRWRKGVPEASTIENASSLRVVGPFPTRQVARNADISDYTNFLIRFTKTIFDTP